MMSFGLRACSTSGPMPMDSRVPGRKFSISTWLSASRSFRMSMQPGPRKFIARDFLLRA